MYLVEASARLIDSPATIVQSEYGVSPTMQKYLRAQAIVENDNQVYILWQNIVKYYICCMYCFVGIEFIRV